MKQHTLFHSIWHLKPFGIIIFTPKYPFSENKAIKPVLSSMLCYSIIHVFHKQHVNILCATVDFGDNLILIPKHTWIIFMVVSSSPFSWSTKLHFVHLCHMAYCVRIFVSLCWLNATNLIFFEFMCNPTCWAAVSTLLRISCL